MDKNKYPSTQTMQQLGTSPSSVSSEYCTHKCLNHRPKSVLEYLGLFCFMSRFFQVLLQKPNATQFKPLELWAWP